MIEFIGIAAATLLLTFLVLRKIVKLPSKYERKPRALTPWSALDHGIDPSTSQGGEK